MSPRTQETVMLRVDPNGVEAGLLESAESSQERPAGGSDSLLRLLAIGGILAVGAGGLLYSILGPDETIRWATLGWERLQKAPPIAFFCFVFIASILPIPISLLYAAAGTLYGVTTALAWTALTALLANLFIYFLCSSFLRPTLIRQIENRGHTVPQLKSKSDETLLITLVRITPGFPYFLQNWLLALAGVGLLRFLSISLLIHLMYASGFVILGRSAFEGELGMVAFAIALLVIISIVARLVHQRIQARRAETENSPRLTPDE